MNRGTMPDNDQIQDMLDREAIRTVLGRYCRGIDRMDNALLESLYHPDAVEQHGGFDGPAKDWREMAVAAVLGPNGPLERQQHLLGSINVDLDGDVALTEAYFSTGCVEMKDGQRMLRTMNGRYLDRFERRNGEWRIARRTVVKDYTDVHVLHDLDQPYPLSQWGQDDLVYHQGEA
jgi:hypothetical protein